MKIFLIGMPGSGKSTLGRKLAERLHIPFVDLDLEIENQEKQSIPEIFKHRGEDQFRKIESEVLTRWAGADKEFVIATGGGAPCFHNGMNVINQAGVSIFLDVPLEQLLLRTSTSKGRPLLAGDAKERLKSLYEKRLPLYQQASVVISGDDIKIQEVVGKLSPYITDAG